MLLWIVEVSAIQIFRDCFNHYAFKYLAYVQCTTGFGNIPEPDPEPDSQFQPEPVSGTGPDRNRLQSILNPSSKSKYKHERIKLYLI